MVFCFSLNPPAATAGCAQWICWLFQTRPQGRSQQSLDLETIRVNRKLAIEERQAAIHQYSAPQRKTWKQKSFVLADWALATLLGTRVLMGLPSDSETILTTLALVPPTLFAADFASQLFHKWLDSYASEQNCIWGAGAREFRKHHEFPDNLNHVDPLSHITAFGPVMMPFFIGANFVDWSPEWGASVWLFLMAGLHATEFHRQAHLKEPNVLFRWLQTARVAISHEAHMKHHGRPFDGEFAILNGWSNAFARRLDLWRRLDLLFWKVTRTMPHNWVQDPSSIPPEVLTDLQEALDEIPAEIEDVAETYPSRVPAEVRELLLKAHAE